MKIKPNNDINLLTTQFKEKVTLFLRECRTQWYNIGIFEWLRTKQRQIELYNQWRLTPWKIVTWTLKSKHLTWEAVDIIFYDTNWKITWNWPYSKIIIISKQFWIDSLSPIEVCHFQDNLKPLIINPIPVMPETSPYTVIHDNLLWSTGFKSLFDNMDSDRITKELIDIALARLSQRIASGKISG